MYFSTFLRVFINCKEKCGENQNFNRSLLFLTHLDIILSAGYQNKRILTKQKQKGNKIKAR